MGEETGTGEGAHAVGETRTGAPADAAREHPLTKAEVLSLLDARGIAYELAEHPAIRTVEEADRVCAIPFAAHMSKNLFLRDDKKRHYYLVTLPDHKRVSLADVQAALGSRRLSFASEADLAAKLGVWPGAVTPLGLLNDAAREVEFHLDADFVAPGRGKVGVHPCDNTASVLLATGDLLALLRAHGSPVFVTELPAL